jgi:hypothetical protein
MGRPAAATGALTVCEACGLQFEDPHTLAMHLERDCPAVRAGA